MEKQRHTLQCHTCGGQLISPAMGYTSEAVKWLVDNGWRMSVNPQEHVKYYCVACGVPVEKKPEAKMEDIF